MGEGAAGSVARGHALRSVFETAKAGETVGEMPVETGAIGGHAYTELPGRIHHHLARARRHNPAAAATAAAALTNTSMREADRPGTKD